jgi:predicted RNase H-like nuclease (RuvC/YqgF family)
MANEDVVNEIEEEIKKAKGEPEDFQIEITDDPAEEAKDVAEEKQKNKKRTTMVQRFKSESKNLLTKGERQRYKLSKYKSKMHN